MAESLTRNSSDNTQHIAQQSLDSTTNDVEDFNKWCDDPIFGEQTWIEKKTDGKEPTTEEKFGATWDTVPPEGKVSEAIRISDPSYERLINGGNIFGSCYHYVVPVHCGCSHCVFTFMCVRCMLLFCSDSCLEQNLRGKGGLSESAIKKLKSRQELLKQPIRNDTCSNIKVMNRDGGDNTNGPRRHFDASQCHRPMDPQNRKFVESENIGRTNARKMRQNPFVNINNSNNNEREPRKSFHGERNPKMELGTHSKHGNFDMLEALHGQRKFSKQEMNAQSLLGPPPNVAPPNFPPPNVPSPNFPPPNVKVPVDKNCRQNTQSIRRKNTKSGQTSDMLKKHQTSSKYRDGSPPTFYERRTSSNPTSRNIASSSLSKEITSTRGENRGIRHDKEYDYKNQTSGNTPAPLSNISSSPQSKERSPDYFNPKPLTGTSDALKDCRFNDETSSPYPSTDTTKSQTSSGSSNTDKTTSSSNIYSSPQSNEISSPPFIAEPITIGTRGARRGLGIGVLGADYRRHEEESDSLGDPPSPSCNISSNTQSEEMPSNASLLPSPRQETNGNMREDKKLESNGNVESVTNTRPVTPQECISDRRSASPPSIILSPTSSVSSADANTTIIGRGRGRGRKLSTKVEEPKEQTVNASPDPAPPATAVNKSEDVPTPELDVTSTAIRTETAIGKPFCPPLLSSFEMGCMYVKTPHLMSLWTVEGARVSNLVGEEINKIENLETAVGFTTGDFVVALYYEGETLTRARAKVLEIRGPRKVFIHYIDFCITEEVNPKMLYKLPEKLYDFPPNDTRFCLSNVKQVETERFWTKEANDFLNDLILQKPVRCVVKYSSEVATGMLYIGELKIKKSHKWVDVGEQLIEAGLAMKMPESVLTTLVQEYWIEYPMKLLPDSESPELALNTRMEVNISHVHHLQDFYVTTVQEKQDRERMMSELNKIMLYPEMCSPFIPHEDTVGVAFIQNNWCRVKVKLVRLDQTVDLLLIDKGEKVKKAVKLNMLRKYPDCLEKVKAYAYRCQLPVVPVNSTKWDSQLIENLKKVQQYPECPAIKCFHIDKEKGMHTVELYPTRDSPGWSHNLIAINDAKDPSSIESAVSPPKIPDDCQSQQQQQQQLKNPGSFAEENHKDPPKPDTPNTNEVKNEKELTTKSEEEILENGGSEVSPAELTITALPVAPELSTLLQDNVKFTVSLTSMWGVVYIVPEVNHRNEVNKVLKDYLAHFQDIKPENAGSLKKDDIVCVKMGENLICRALVEMMKESTTLLRLLDHGEYKCVQNQDIIPATREIMKFPPIGYSIKLPNAPQNSKLLSSKKSLLKAKLKNSFFKLHTIEGPHPSEAMLTIATLRSADESSLSGDNSLSGFIANYEKMNWELYFDAGYTTTPDIVTKGGKWPIQTVEKFYNKEKDIALQKTMTSVVFRAFLFEEDLMVALLKPNSEELIADLKIISSKMETYYQKVKAGGENMSNTSNNSSSSFVAVRIADPSDVVKTVFSDPKWHRCIKSGNNLLSVDHHKEWSADSDGQFEIAEIRELCPEFLEIPSACFLAKIPGIDINNPLTRIATEQFFSPGCRVKFSLTSVDKEDGEKSIYTLKCPLFEKCLDM